MRKKPRKGYQAYLLVKAGTHSHAEAARALGVSRASVSYECRKQGIGGQTERGKRNSARARVAAARRAAASYRAAAGIDPLKIQELVGGRLSYTKVGRALGLTRGQVAGYIHRIKSGVQYGAQAGE